MESVDDLHDLQRDFADVDINNGVSNIDDEPDEEEEVPAVAAVANNNSINEVVMHVR